MSNPSFIYKYLTPEAALAVLGSQNLRFSKYTSFNDCFECWFTILPPSEIELRNYVSEKLDNIYNLKKFYIDYLLSLKNGERIFRQKAELYRNKGDNKKANSFEMGIEVQFRSQLTLYDYDVENLTDEIFFEFFKNNEKTFYCELLNILQLKSSEWNYIFSDSIKNIKTYIGCFSENKDHHLMVGHYTNGGKGLILEFDFHKLFSEFDVYRKIQYCDTPEAYKCIDIIKNNGLPIDFIKDKIILKKQKDWKYENEWRVVYETNSSSGEFVDVKIPQDSINSVLLGPYSSLGFARTVFLLTKQFYPTAKVKLLIRSHKKYDFIETAEIADLHHLEVMKTGIFSK